MKKTSTLKAHSAADVKEKRKPAVLKETRPKTTKQVSRPAPVETAPEAPALRHKRSEDENGGGTRAKRGARSKTFRFDDDLMQDYVMDDDVSAAGLDEELTIEPMELPLELLDPELVEVPRPASPPKPKPKPVTGRRQQTCANCGHTFNWLSVDQLCFSCLKKKLAQKKREDETYPGFTGEPEEEEEPS